MNETAVLTVYKRHSPSWQEWKHTCKLHCPVCTCDCVSVVLKHTVKIQTHVVRLSPVTLLLYLYSTRAKKVSSCLFEGVHVFKCVHVQV